MLPRTTKQWTIEGHEGWDQSLKFSENAVVQDIGDHDVLVRFHAASVNYRDLIMVKGLYKYAQNLGVVAGSEGAGAVEAVGPQVTRFKPGDNVVTNFHQGHIYGAPDMAALCSGLGGALDGVIRELGVFNEQGLVRMPRNLNFLEASTLSCSAVTAWNSLYGLESKALKAGDWVLVQGSGGVSIFGLQFAKAAGAKVIATTSSPEKVERLKKLGADHVINYKEDEKWGETAKSLTPNQEGVNHILEVGGPATIAQAFKALKLDGNISIIGFLTGYTGDGQSFLDCLTHYCTVRGIIVGSRAHFEDMNKCIEANDIHPVIDQKIFSLEEVKEAYQYLSDQQFFGKVVIKID
ncbi:hypothetical protein MMC17_003739 [Xylographa soralifera]|nr:hypothetical protein [Xylographa soralifera]